MSIRRGIGTDYNGVCKLMSFYDEMNRPLKRTEKLEGAGNTRHTVVEYWDDEGRLVVSSLQCRQPGKIPHEVWFHTHWLYGEKKVEVPITEPKTFRERLGDFWKELMVSVKKLFNKA
jgi:hypothetical protein